MFVCEIVSVSENNFGLPRAVINHKLRELDCFEANLSMQIKTKAKIRGNFLFVRASERIIEMLCFE